MKATVTFNRRGGLMPPAKLREALGLKSDCPLIARCR
jgi:bifunctional DNA-binding transcriptional regulator/antitoxin component of YhaV-PrlF toxin-antitoxin module